ncbi:ATP-binding cassette domain-containing protein [Amycolatopsis thermoflava]|uniref:Monosaccharide ABC transporter ATP-binding protein (CUT2 family) n=1 Tax=Amycolatopsis thermoflava TaxID=84480 RepID=A0A3N2H4X0_9PSEU|nr:ATP-binding cassette domain-containing protein [Amycolatopsis thermoflava]ROS43972.1 monosaccharide ABC transporter ATP-binding protein (CUT2 family) [Amycolatopsis thermoflava]
MTTGTVLEVAEVTKRFGNHAALDAVSFSVREREVVALLGDNGAGKSTLVKCIAGIHRPERGTIYVDGKPLNTGGAGSGRDSGIGIVYQDLALFDNMSVAENLFAGREPCWPRAPRGLGVVRRRAMLEEARRTLHRLEVRVPNLKTPVGLLSGGQRQAIAVSKGIAFARKIVVLDEPTAALGIRERTNVLRLVRQLPENGISVILISHNLEEVISVADRAVVLRQGKMVGEVAATAENHETIVSLIVGGRTPLINGQSSHE